MTAVSFTGLASVVDRTVFTAKGPIVKAPAPLLTGANLRVLTPTTVSIPTGSFNSSAVGKSLSVSGSQGGRNDGTFYVSSAASPTVLVLEGADFDVTDVTATTSALIALVNDLLAKFNAHLTRTGVHGVNDPGNSVNAQEAVDLASADIVLNALLPKFDAHVQLGSPVHLAPDVGDVVTAPPAASLESAILMANRLRLAYEAHRSSEVYHLAADSAGALSAPAVDPVLGTYPGPLTGPLAWTLYDPRTGEVADDPSDVRVLVNGVQASVDAVFGLLGAVVLTSRPAHLSTVTVDYGYMANPPVQFGRLNSPEYNLNQVGNRGFSGFPQHRYRARAALAVPKNLALPAIRSFTAPRLNGWRYKGAERAYSAVLNDPNTLLLNVPTNRLTYPVLQASVFETVLRYDPTTLPQVATDPWTLEGDAAGATVNSSVPELLITDSSATANDPPFFTHALDLTFPSLVSAAFRAAVYDATEDGVFTGACFGLSDGARAAVVGFVSTDANNLSSCIVRVNDLKAALDAHVVQPTVHDPDDAADSVSVVDATDLASAVILANALKAAFNAHVAKGGTYGVHNNADPADLLISPDAKDLTTLIALVNEMRASLNAHLVAPGVHFVNDGTNSVGLVKQVGILTSRGYPEFSDSWNSYATDWTVYRTYRIFRDSSGAVSLFLSGDVSPIASVSPSELPPISSLDGRFDPLQQAFFGSIGRESTSSVGWAFVRVDVNPLDSNQVGDNKSVIYSAATVPELDPTAPWIVVGQGGYDRISGSQLVVDSTASAPAGNVDALGLSSGAYRGFLRYEPIMTARASSSVEFTASVGYYTFSLDDRASGVFLDDDLFSVHLVFLQATPTPASVTGSSFGPFTGLDTATDTLIVSVDGAEPVTADFAGIADAYAATVAARINSFFGYALAAPVATDAYPVQRIRLTSPTSGSSSRVQVVGGTAATKLGLAIGTYFGRDSNPEPKISWFGEFRPDLDSPSWTSTGSQTPQMLFRTLRITDASYFDYLAYALSDSLTTGPVISASADWKLDARLAVQSYVPGASVSGYYLCGAFVSLDEGAGGRNVQLRLSADLNGIPYVSIMSLNGATNSLALVTSVPFAWNDQKPHTFNVFTSKGANTVVVLADGTAISSFPYSGLQAGVSGPAVAFGSGGPPVLNADLRSSQSVVDWSSVAVFRDSKIADPSAAGRRYVGLYKGGDKTLLSSYYLQQVDWTASHTYRVVRDPSSAVSVFLDGAEVPVISVNYDVLSLPPASSSFLKGMTGGRPAVAFGSFNPYEIDRTQWTEVKYSIGKITLTDRLVPSHQTVSQMNAMVSPDHLLSATPHAHAGFRVYSGGTPADDFLADEKETSFTVLGAGTAPVPMTQDLQYRQGMRPTFTPVESIDSASVVNQAGFLSSFEDDLVNASSASAAHSTVDATAALVARVNDVKASYSAHLSRIGVHVLDDGVNTISSPSATDLASAIVLVNELQTKFDAHLSQAGVHVHPDLANSVASVASATDLSSAALLAEAIASAYSAHARSGPVHKATDSADVVGGTPIDLLGATVALVNGLKSAFNFHMTAPGVHVTPDLADTVTSPAASDLSSAITMANEIRSKFGTHSQSVTYHALSDVPDLVLSPAASDLVSLLTLSNELLILYNAHRTGRVAVPQLDGTVLQTPVHPIDDTVHVESDSSAYGLFLGVLQDFANKYNSHRVARVLGVPAHALDDLVGGLGYTVLYRASPPVSFDPASMASQVNASKAAYDAHLVRAGVHVLNDLWDGEALADATDFLTAEALLEDLVARFNAHLSADSYHLQADAVDALTTAAAYDPLPGALALANDLRAKMNAHVQYKPSHGRVEPLPPAPDPILPPDADPQPVPPEPPSFLVLSPAATDLASLLVLVGDEQGRFGSHLGYAGVHVGQDTADVLTSPTPSDLDSAVTALNELLTKFNAHLTRAGVHGSAVFVRLDPPAGVLYESTKFWEFPSGDYGVLSPFSDDETVFFDGFKSQGDKTLTYPAGAAPEHAVLVGNNVEPFPIVAGDSMGVALDGGSSVTVTFQASDTSVANVVTRINSTPGISAGFAQDNGDGRVRLTSSVGASNSAIAVTGSALSKLGLDAAQTTPWVLLSGDPAAVTVVPMYSAPTDYLRYSTVGAGTDTVYVTKSGLPDAASMDFDLTFGLRVNTAVPGPTGDTGIYVGMSGRSGPGFTAAVGFEFVNGIRTVKVVDLKSGQPKYQRAFNWGDGNFHVYRLSHVQSGDAIQFSILS